MTLDDAIAAVLASTSHDTDDGTSDGQVTEDQITNWLNQRYIQVRRLLTDVAPTLYTVTAPSVTLTTTATTIALPDDYETVARLERQVLANPTTWRPVDVSDHHRPDQGTLNYREEEGVLKLAPAALVPGTYRLIYIASPTLLTEGSQSFELPRGLEDHLVEWVAGRVRTRGEEDGGPHFQLAEKIWNEQKRSLRRRYQQPVPAMRRVYGW